MDQIKPTTAQIGDQDQTTQPSNTRLEGGLSAISFPVTFLRVFHRVFTPSRLEFLFSHPSISSKSMV